LSVQIINMSKNYWVGRMEDLRQTCDRSYDNLGQISRYFGNRTRRVKAPPSDSSPGEGPTPIAHPVPRLPHPCPFISHFSLFVIFSLSGDQGQRAPKYTLENVEAQVKTCVAGTSDQGIEVAENVASQASRGLGNDKKRC